MSETAGPLPNGSNRAQILYWLADQMGVWAPGLFDLPPEVGQEFIALCEALGSRRERQLQAIEGALRMLASKG
jgi:hypothetical protein